jgi:hypothetical protein
MFKILYKYFVINRKVGVPGIGVFFIERQPSNLDFIKKAFTAPSARIGFKVGNAAADETFFLFAADELKTNPSQAASDFSNFAQSLTTTLHIDGKVDLPGMGLLSKDVTGTLHFTQVSPLPSFYKDAPIERTIVKVAHRETAIEEKNLRVQHEKIPPVEITQPAPELLEEVAEEAPAPSTAKSYRWVFALGLALLAVAAIIYYYLENGSLR